MMVFSLKIYQIHAAVKQAGTLNATYPVKLPGKSYILVYPKKNFLSTLSILLIQAPLRLHTLKLQESILHIES